MTLHPSGDNQNSAMFYPMPIIFIFSLMPIFVVFNLSLCCSNFIWKLCSQSKWHHVLSDAYLCRFSYFSFLFKFHLGNYDDLGIGCRIVSFF